jgi:hypothetical protein
MQNLRVFTVPECVKGRRRFITHTPAENKSLQATGQLHEQFATVLPQTRALLARATEQFKFSATVDFASYYHQFALNESDSPYMFRWRHRTFCITTIPTGHSLCPFLGQTFSSALMYEVQKRLRCQGIEMSFDVYIDNVRWFVQSVAFLHRANIMVFNVAHEFGVTINESLQHIQSLTGQQHCFLGVDYHLKKSTISLAKTFVPKLKDHPHLCQYHIRRDPTG